jgi:RNAse (barnase) inhibitor barstar
VTKATLEIDGRRFTTLEGFYDEVSARLIPDRSWGHNLDAFNDILRGGFGTPADGFRLVWRHAEKSRHDLGYPETARQLASSLEQCHPSGCEKVGAQLAAAKEHKGPTVFDWLVEIIGHHDDIELVLS